MYFLAIDIDSQTNFLFAYYLNALSKFFHYTMLQSTQTFLKDLSNMDIPINIPTLPKDNLRRVVWCYGALIQNPSALSTNPLARIGIKTIQADGNLSDTTDVHDVTVTKLDRLKIGTIIEDQLATKDFWKKYPKPLIEDIHFSFNFDIHEPESIYFGESLPDSKNKYIPPFAYSLGTFNDKFTLHRFLNSRLTKLLTPQGITILIPSVEFFTSAIVPHKEIRTDLLKLPLHALTDKYLLSASIDWSDGYKYRIESKEPHTDRTSTFLAYARLNDISISRLSKLRASMLTASPKIPASEKDPIVLPYHPSNLALRGDGIWITPKLFFMFRINDCSIPTDYDIHCTNSIERAKNTVPKPKNNNSDNEEPPQPIPHEEYEIDDKNDPNPNLGKKYITSPVGTIGPKPNITRSINVIETDRTKYTIEDNQQEPPSENNPDDIESEETNIHPVSSGEPIHSKDSEFVKPLDLKEKTTPNSLPADLQKMANALMELAATKDSKIDSVIFIDKKTSEYSKPISISFHTHELRPDYEKKWHILKKEKQANGTIKSILRQFLIAKIVFKDKTTGYLLEIQTRASESFFSLLFNTNTTVITSKDLKKLLIAIMENKGRYTTRTVSSKSTSSSAPKTPPKKLEPLPVASMMRFKHYGKTITASQLARAIERGIKNEIFH